MPDDFKKLDSTGSLPESAKDTTIAKLESQIQNLKDSKNENMFWFAFVAVVLFDAVCFTNLSASGIAAVIFMELVGLLCAAKRLGMETVVEILAWTIRRLRGPKE